jgi:hypothetical protein
MVTGESMRRNNLTSRMHTRRSSGACTAATTTETREPISFIVQAGTVVRQE